jgi:proteasome assembly chaperone (PAC2) family protein
MFAFSAQQLNEMPLQDHIEIFIEGFPGISPVGRYCPEEHEKTFLKKIFAVMFLDSESGDAGFD